MEHLPIHLAREAELGGPVQYRWMYLVERSMYHFKQKVKNLSRVEGSIVSQSINEETSQFAAYYFAPEVQTKSRKPSRHDDGGQRTVYPVEVPTIFSQIGRVSGKGKGRRLTEQEHMHLHKYILANCEEVMTYERIYMEQIRGAYPNYTEDQLSALKENEFVNWLKFYVSFLKSILYYF
ncbi:PREDICTED: uncharacterized protein LOC106296987 [Brassica oleracea var. oleracea]|uniref:uncharacterized protein LOC106296987 n=1 Tax=Brassica oleracea var. oleracea TaxID=109376 RepID=UPI0006A6E18B|nr:PREDICTED: uncharacterized protein LOC106296987 [Brassica oleracea var. oleracea]